MSETDIVFTIDKDISPERLEEYKKVLNELIGYEAEWKTSMSETDIPADIRAAAAAVIDQYDERGMLDAVARAILDERERCARIAEAEIDPDAQYPDFEGGYTTAAETIAAAIRGDIAQELVDQAQKLKMGYE